MKINPASLRKSRNLFPVSLLAGVTLSALLLQGCKATQTATEAVATVQAQHPVRGEIAEHIIADAMLSPISQAAISPKITAPIRAFYVQRGSKVRTGELLAVLENRDLAAAAIDNKGQYMAAQAAYDIQTKAQLPDDYVKAQLEVAQARTQLDLEKQIAASRKKLFIEGAIAGRDYDTSAAAVVQAKAAYDIARNRFDSLKKVSRKAALQQAQGQLSSAKGKYLAAEAQIAYSEIRSPINGVVTDRPFFSGEMANAGATMITVMDTSTLLAKVHLSQSDAQRLSLGDEASISVPGEDKPVPATVSLISPALDPGSTTIEVWLRIDNSGGKLKVGTPVRISILGRKVADALKIPLSAVLTAQDGTKTVMTVGPGGRASVRAVSLGINDGSNVQVTKGLSAGDIVITAGSYGLDDGTEVKLAGPEPDAGGRSGQTR
jgi:multidrug efflux pump subunit AcrA (membrane-fusion protein)